MRSRNLIGRVKSSIFFLISKLDMSGLKKQNILKQHIQPSSNLKCLTSIANCLLIIL